MQHTIKLNRKIFKLLLSEANRVLGPETNVKNMFEGFIFSNLSVIDSKEVVKYGETIREDILENEGVLIETLKFISLLEVSTNEAELRALVNRCKEIKHGKPLTDFDKILKSIMTVPSEK